MKDLDTALCELDRCKNLLREVLPYIESIAHVAYTQAGNRLIYNIKTMLLVGPSKTTRPGKPPPGRI